MENRLHLWVQLVHPPVLRASGYKHLSGTVVGRPDCFPPNPRPLLCRQMSNISVPWTTREITATQFLDFVAASGIVEFTPSSYAAQVVSVVVNGDDTFEGNETFAINITPPAKYADASASTAIVTIMDDDPVSRLVGDMLFWGTGCPALMPLNMS